MKRKRNLAAVISIILLVLSLCIPAIAAEVPQLNVEGSIKVTLTYKNKPVTGGELILYQVGDVAQDNGNYSFTLAKDYVSSRVSLENISSADTAKALEQYVQRQKMKGVTKKLDKNGTVVFDKLYAGLYLLLQKEAIKGYEKVNAFLVSLPSQENGSYVYQVDATPKVQVKGKQEKETEPPTPPGTPGNPPSNPPGSTGNTPPPRLPQTGQLKWPIPVLAIAGLCLLLLGWTLRRGKGRYENEA